MRSNTSKQPRSLARYLICKFLFLLFLISNGAGVQNLVGQEIEVPAWDTPRSKEIPCVRYTEPGSTNGLWDWRRQEYQITYYPGNAPAITRTVASPFHQVGFTFHPNTNFLTSGVPDYDPADGWELLYRNFGTPQVTFGGPGPVGEPSFGLYNRYSSLVRIFYWLEPNGETVYQNMTLNVSNVDDFGNAKVSAIFENLNIPANPLENFDKSGLSVGQLNEIIINGTWMILEFPASYDPCVCLHETSLEIRPVLSSITAMNFNIDGTGNSQAIYGPGSTSGSYLGTGLDYVNGALGSIQSGYKVYDDLTNAFGGGFIEYLQNSEVGTLEFIGGVLPDWFPKIGVAAKILGFVVGKGKTTGPTKLLGFNHTFEFEGTGQLFTTGPYEVHTIYTPGAYYDYRNPQAHRTVYDNPLGILQVLEAPKVAKYHFVNESYDQTGEFDFYEISKFRYTGDFKYAINEVAGISGTPIRLMGALVWTNCQGEGVENNFYSTPLINLNCLEDYTVEIEFDQSAQLNTEGKLVKESFGIECNGNPELQIVAVLESSLPNYDDEIVFSARYKVELMDVSDNIVNFPANPFEDLNAAEIFTVCDPPAPAPVRGENLIDFCENNYDPSIGLGLVGQPSVNPLEEALDIKQERPSAGVYPNPIIDHFSLTIPLFWEIELVDITILDLNGKTMQHWDRIEVIPGASFGFTEGVAGLPAGQYFLRVIRQSGVESFPIIKQ